MAYLLFIGNSYTFVNDLNLMTEALIEQGAARQSGAGWAADWSEVATTRLAGGGYTFEMHAAQVGVSAEWTDALTGGTAWRYGILQEQSQIPGFYGEDPIWDSSLAAARTLDGYLQASGAGTFLLLTWGRRDGDSQNAWLYPDFPTMQAELTEGYLAYRDALSAPDRPVWIAPAGPAFAVIYDAAVAAGEVPQDGLFGRLYDADGSHPSPLGSYLVACVLYASLTGDDPQGLPAPPALAAPELAADVATAQGAAATVVFSGQWAMPWDAPDDTGSDTGNNTDTGSDTDSDTDSDTGSGDSASDADTGTDSPTGDAGAADSGAPPGEEEKGGCGCAGAGGAAWLALAPGLLWLRRRK